MNKKIIKICSIIMVMALIALSLTACGGKEYEKTENTTDQSEATSNTEAQKPLGNINPLTGEANLADSAVGLRPVAVMVENSPQARPQWGLTTPDIVIEGLVEGGITRMMWLYADATKIPKIGPVRSARHDYAEIAKGLNAIYAHAGDSPQANSFMKSAGVDNIDGLSAPGFKRDSSRKAPHNLTTSGKDLLSTISKYKINTKAKDTNWMPFTFAEDTRAAFGDMSGSCSSISVTFSQSYKHTFKYNADEKVYYNYMNNKEMKDGNNNETMKVTNVILIYCPVSTIPGEEKSGRQDWNLDNGGKAVFVSHGYGEQITWKKEGKSAPLKFYGKDGKLLTVNKGKTWIGILPDKNQAYTQVVE